MSLLLIFHSTESISNNVGNELGILKLLEFKKNSEPISFCFYTGAQSVWRQSWLCGTEWESIDPIGWWCVQSFYDGWLHPISYLHKGSSVKSPFYEVLYLDWGLPIDRVYVLCMCLSARNIYCLMMTGLILKGHFIIPVILEYEWLMYTGLFLPFFFFALQH